MCTNIIPIKTTTYTPLQLSLEEKEFQVELLPFEITSSGHIKNHNKKGIENYLKKHGIKLNPQILTNLSNISLLCTMIILYDYQTSECVAPILLEPWHPAGVDFPAVRRGQPFIDSEDNSLYLFCSLFIRLCWMQQFISHCRLVCEDPQMRKCS